MQKSAASGQYTVCSASSSRGSHNPVTVQWELSLNLKKTGNECTKFHWKGANLWKVLEQSEDLWQIAGVRGSDQRVLGTCQPKKSANTAALGMPIWGRTMWWL